MEVVVCITPEGSKGYKYIYLKIVVSVLLVC